MSKQFKLFVFSIVSLFIFQSSYLTAQEKAIYVGIDGKFNKFYTFIEVVNEVAFVEVMNEPKSGLVRKLYEERITKNSNTFVPYKTDLIEINADFTKITFNTLSKDKITSHVIQLNPFLDDIQVLDAERNKAYFNDKTIADISYLDSIIGKGNYLETQYYSYIESYRSDDKDAQLPQKAFKDSLNNITNNVISKILKRDLPYIEFMNSYNAKTTFTKEEIELFLKKADFTKMGETKILTQMLEKSGDTFLAYLDESKTLTNKKNTISQEFKDVGFYKLNKEFHKRIKKSLSNTTIKSESKHKIKHLMRKAHTKRVIYRTLPIIGYGVAIYFIVTLI